MGKWLCIVAALVACGKAEKTAEPAQAKPAERPKPAWLAGVELPQVTDGFDAVDGPGHVVTLSMTELLLDSKPVVAVTNGMVDPSVKEGGALGIKIAPLTAILKAEREHARLQLVIDKRLGYRSLVELVYSANQAGVREFVVVAERGTVLVGAPFTMPDKTAVVAAADDAGAHRPGADLAKQIEAVRLEGRAGGVGGRVEAAGKVKIETTDTGTVVDAVHARYKPGIRRCFQEALKRDPAARGKIRIAMTIAETGRVVHGTAKGFDRAVDSCIEQQMSTWRFAKADQEKLAEFTLQLAAETTEAPRERAAALDPAAIEPPTIAKIESRPLPQPAEHPGAQPVQLLVAVTKSDLIVASISGLEGTLREPKLRVDVEDPEASAKLAKQLAEIAERRGEKSPVILMAAPEIPMQRVAEVLGAIRTTYPDVLFASGFY